MRKLLIWGLVLFLLASLGSAFNNTDVMTVLHFNNNITDETKPNNFTWTCASCTYNTTSIEGTHSFVGDDTRYAVSTSQYNQSITDNISMSFWFRTTSTNEQVFAGTSSGGAFFSICSSCNYITYNTLNGGAPCVIKNISHPITDGDWHLIVGTLDSVGDTQSLYIDGDLHATTGSCSPTEAVTNEELSWMSTTAGETPLETGGNFDAATFWRIALSSSEVTELYNGGTGLFYPYNVSGKEEGTPPEEVVGDSINMSVPEPEANAEFNVQTINFNVSVNASNQFNCSIYFNETYNTSIDNHSSGVNQIADFNVTFGATEEATFNYTIGCFDGTNDTNATTTLFYVDLVDPTLTVDSVLSSNRYVCFNGTNLTSNFSLSDAYLWGFNLTIDKTTVVFNTTNIAGSTYDYILSVDPSDYNLNEGEHTLNVFVSDSHTTKSIPDYLYYKNPLSKSIRYDFGKDWIKINPTNTGLFSSFDTWKNKDRYVFEFERDFTAKLLYGTDLEFEVTSSQKLDLVDSEFPGHIISNSLGKWIDFDSQFKNAVVTAEKVDDYKIRVLVEGINDDEILFNSIGGLNIVEQNYTFYYGNVTETYTSQTIETERTDFTANFSINDTYVDDIVATFYFDGTYYAPTTKTSSANSIYFTRTLTSSLLTGVLNESNTTFFWNYSVTNNGDGNNITNSSTTLKNQTIFKMIVSNCTQSVADTVAINFTVLDQITDNPAFVVPEGSFQIWTGSSSSSRTYGIDWENSSSFNLCIYPSHVNLSSTYTLLYTGYGDTSSRIRTNDSIDNDTEYVTLYIVTEGTEIEINVVDENDDPIEDLDVEAWIYNVVGDNYTLIAEEATDIDGIANMRLYTDDEDKYRFLIYDGTTLLYTSSTFKLWDTSYTFRIVRGTLPNSTLIALQSLDYDLAIDKTNNNFTLTWDDTLTNLISAMNLTVYVRNATNETRLYSQISTANSGTLFYNFSANGTYIAYAYATSSGDGLVYFLDSLSHSIMKEWDLFETDTLIMAFLFIGTMAFIGLAHHRGGELALIMTIVGMVIFWMCGLIQVALSSIVSIIISAIIIMVRLQKRIR